LEDPQMLLSILRLALQRADPPTWFVSHVPDQPINMCLAVSDECKLLREKCSACVPLLVETLDVALLLSTSNNHCWPRELTVLITTFL